MIIKDRYSKPIRAVPTHIDAAIAVACIFFDVSVVPNCELSYLLDGNVK